MPKKKLVLAAKQIEDFAIGWHARLAAVSGTIDDIADRGAVLFDEQLSRQFRRMPARVSWLIGWSPRQEAGLILEFDPSRPAGERMKKVRAVVSHELAEEERLKLEALVAHAASPRQVDMAAFGLAVMESQRGIPAPPGRDGRRHFRIGGYASQIEISRDGIRQTVLHQWPDRVGRPIDPFGLVLQQMV
ncbi:hypothetical protein [Jiella sp. M17.18]|uniref:hypothetical protein n=1 Tax=Jiella sp. M17.18 TaxID=3234247 RepID=UPI0034DF4F3E